MSGPYGLHTVYAGVIDCPDNDRSIRYALTRSPGDEWRADAANTSNEKLF